MVGPLTVKVSSEWQLEAPTGYECSACGDPCLLEQHRFCVIVDGRSTLTEVVLCMSCVQMVDQSKP